MSDGICRSRAREEACEKDSRDEISSFHSTLVRPIRQTCSRSRRHHCIARCNSCVNLSRRVRIVPFSFVDRSTTFSERHPGSMDRTVRSPHHRYRRSLFDVNENVILYIHYIGSEQYKSPPCRDVSLFRD